MSRLVASIILVTTVVIVSWPFVAIAFAVESKAGPWRGVSVLDRSGHRWADVTLALTEDGHALLVIPAGGARIPLAFADLVVVYNGEGENITEIVLGSRADSPAVEWAAGEIANDVAVSSQASPALIPQATSWWSGASFEAGAGVAGGAGEWFAGTKTEAFLEGGLRIWCARNAYLHLLVRSQAVGTATYTSPVQTVYTTEYAMQSYQLLFGSSMAGRPGKGAKVMKYIEAGGGVMRYRRVDYGRDDYLSRFAVAAQVGALVKIGHSLAVDVGAHAFFKPARESKHESGGASLGLGVALAYMR
jgi:hypothetical protein